MGRAFLNGVPNKLLPEVDREMLYLDIMMGDRTHGGPYGQTPLLKMSASSQATMASVKTNDRCEWSPVPTWKFLECRAQPHPADFAQPESEYSYGSQRLYQR